MIYGFTYETGPLTIAMSDYSDGSRVACHKFHWFSARKNVVPFQSPPMVCLPPNQILQEESTTLLKTSQQDTAGPRGTQLMENRDPLISFTAALENNNKVTADETLRRSTNRVCID